jgi:hypothetical protein
MRVVWGAPRRLAAASGGFVLIVTLLMLSGGACGTYGEEQQDAPPATASPGDGSTTGDRENNNSADGDSADLDSSLIGDASADAPSFAGAWCKSNAPDAMFCEDFDRNTFARFTQTQESGGTASIIDAAASSAPFAARFSGAGPAVLRLAGFRDSSRASSSASVAVDLNINKTNSGTQPAQLVSLSFVGGATTYQVGVGIGGGPHDRYAFRYDTASADYAVVSTGGAFPLGTWVRVTLRLRISMSGTGTLDVAFNGVPFVNGAQVPTTVTNGLVRAGIGIPFANSGHDGWTVLADNVVFNVE